MTEQPPASPAATIAAALARIEVAYPALAFADERAADEAGEGFRRALRVCRYQLWRAASAQPARLGERTEGAHVDRGGHRDGCGA